MERHLCCLYVGHSNLYTLHYQGVDRRMLSNGVSIHTICRHSQLLASLLRSFLLVSGVEPRDVAVSLQTVALGVSLTHRWQ